MRKLGYLLLLLPFLACKEEEKFSEIPEITFSEFRYYKDAAAKDTAIDFIFKFKDGDGDIGFSEDEFDNSCGADNNNLYIAYEERRGNDFAPKNFWLQVTEVTPACDTLVYFDSVQVKFDQRMQYVEPAGSKKSIEGEVFYRINGINLLILSSSGRFVFYIRDRANHMSNTVTSPELVLNK